MGKGRKRKAGRRTPSGRLSRAGQVKRIAGNDRAEAVKLLYGTNGTDPIGRAYERGLLGSGQDAKAMLDTARAIFRAYWAAYANGPIRCTLADRNSGASIDEDGEREARVEQWLHEMLATANAGGPPSRKLFDELVIDINPDEGPPWMDRLLASNRRYPATMQDWGRLSCALDVLAECAGVSRPTLRRA